MRILAATAQDSPDAAGRAIAALDPVVTAVSAITPDDACTIAAKHSIRYAVQSWDVPEEGKAIFWKPSLQLQGLYRTQFQSRDPAGPPSGMLRVTFLWNGEPLHVMCVQVSAVREDADWQLLQISRELDEARGPTLLAIDPGPFAVPAWPALADVWSCAGVRAIAYESAVQLDAEARSAFGVVPPRTPALGDDAPACWMRLLCSVHFSVIRAARRRAAASPRGCAAISADVVLAESEIALGVERAGGAYVT